MAEVKELHDDLINNKLGEIDRLKAKMDEKDQQWRGEIKRVNHIADHEVDLRVQIENNLRDEIKTLKEELRNVKVVLRYPNLYHKYYQKSYEEIEKGLKNEDKGYYDYCVSGSQCLDISFVDRNSKYRNNRVITKIWKSNDRFNRNKVQTQCK